MLLPAELCAVIRGGGLCHGGGPRGEPGVSDQADVSKINAGLAQGLQQAEVKAQYAGLGLEVVLSTPQGFTDVIKADSAKFSKLIKDAGIKIE